MSLRPHPIAAFILSLLGGVIILLSSFFVIIIGSAITFFIGGVGGYVGIFGILNAGLVIYCALKLRTTPKMHVTYGSIILIASFTSWFSAIGGFGIGFILALFGGILGIIWKNPYKE